MDSKSVSCLTDARLNALLDRFPDLSLLVVGDYFLDKYLIIDRALSEVSIETGLEAYQVVEKHSSPGAAGTVMNNLSALGIGTLLALGVCGDDGEGYELRQGLHARRVNTDHLLRSDRLFTPTYVKPMIRDVGVGCWVLGVGTGPSVSNTQHPTPYSLHPPREIERLDIKNRAPLAEALEAAVLERLRAVAPRVDGVIVADQVQERNCGVITDRVRAELAALGERYPEKVFFVDSRVRIGEFRTVSVKPNRSEAAAALLGEEGVGCRVSGSNDPSPPDTRHPTPDTLSGSTIEEARELARRFQVQNGRPAYVTLGDLGILVAEAGGVTHVPGIPVTGEIDVVGAGDSATAGIVSALCAGATPTEAALVGNLVASITVQQIGTTGTATPEQVRERFRAIHSDRKA